jgi:2-amino-4-hydroxy-6-hydroxymethyldihydropteridine diphosphokinase
MSTPPSPAANAVPVRAYVGMGANLGDPAGQLRAALSALAGVPFTRLVAVSSLYRSAPVGYADQPDFFNAVAALDTTLDAPALLAALLDIERSGGRARSFRNAPRTIDLDLLLYGEYTVIEPGLTVPHPRMTERAFVMLPLSEIAPGCTVPGHGTAHDLAGALTGQSIERAGALQGEH